MVKGRERRTNWKVLARKRYRQAVALFILYIVMSVFCGYTLYKYGYEKPVLHRMSAEMQKTTECQCFHWGCYCCEGLPYGTILYDLDRDIVNVAVYKDCTKYVQLPGVALDVELSSLKCDQLRDYYENGRRCKGFLFRVCVYPKIDKGWVSKFERKAALLKLMMVQNCSL